MSFNQLTSVLYRSMKFSREEDVTRQSRRSLLTSDLASKRELLEPASSEVASVKLTHGCDLMRDRTYIPCVTFFHS